ncbi:MAG TPA: glutamate--tRNA ligase [Alphaproteobacteria bacterium]|nr:glutamate--tRNA ligase [Alphaproteobacteria bacterium]
MTNIKVRFAPSPTGHMHIGNTRTALFNWLWAKKMGGEFMLRIDDTDFARSKKEYEDSMRESLKWLGLTWSSEARQSARFERYKEITEKLIKEGRIYACYETPEELEFKRKRALSKGLPPIYDRQALSYTKEDIAAFEKEGRKPHYRFKLNAGEIKWNDAVRGEVKYDAANLSDPIIIREDGSYLYHLPSVIDDSDFGITHILRGEDHVTNTASQIQMFEAIGGFVPTFAHLPLLTGKEGKLSKRLGSLGVRELRAEGVENMAICSYLAKLGTSEDIRSFYSLDELAETLDFSKIGHAQPKFDVEDLKHFNIKHIHTMPYTSVKDRVSVDEAFWNKVKANLEKVEDINVWARICNDEITPSIENKALTDMAADLLENKAFDEETFSAWMNAVKEKSGLKGKDLFHPIRMALTGEASGPELKTLLPLIGYEKAYRRLKGQKA